MKIITWYWRQTPNRHNYDAEKVNVWAAQLRRHGIEWPLACITEHPEGIDPSIEIIAPPGEFLGVKVDAWKEANLAPQCYPRLAMFGPKAAEWIGADEWVCMDLDVTVHRELVGLFVPGTDFRIMNGTSSKRPYNGGLVQMRAGARPQVYEAMRKDPVGVATKARGLFVGSDQAVISMVLGRGEKTFGPDDGVEYFGPRWVRMHGGETRLTPPANMRLLFYPGTPKPWELLDRHGFINAAWNLDGKPRGTAKLIYRPSRPPVSREVLHAYDDPKKWGRMFRNEAEKIRGLECRLFVRESRVPDGARAFVRVDQQGPQRDVSRELVFALNRRGCITLPTLQEAKWYDDKVAQLPALSGYMPATWHLADREKAMQLAAALPWGRGLQIVSKAAEGSSSANVRLLRSRQEAEAEVAKIFGDGIALRYGRVQRGYLYWQRLVPENPCDYRVCVVGSFLYGLVRANRPGTFTASGSGNFRALTLDDSRERAAAALAVRISRAIGTKWMAYDFVFDEDGAPLVLEMSSAWTMKAYEACPMFDFALQRTKQTGARSFKIAVDVLRSMGEDAEAA